MNNDTLHSVSRSIVEEVMEHFRQADDSLAEALRANFIELQDFILLSLIYDQPQMTVAEIRTPLGLSAESTAACVERLLRAKLLFGDEHADTGSIDQSRYELTSAGRMVTRRILQTDRN